MSYCCLYCLFGVYCDKGGYDDELVFVDKQKFMRQPCEGQLMGLLKEIVCVEYLLSDPLRCSSRCHFQEALALCDGGGAIR